VGSVRRRHWHPLFTRCYTTASAARVALAELLTGGFTALCVHIGKMKKLKNKTVVRRRGKNDR